MTADLMNRFEIGARVRLTAEHLRSTGQYTGPEAPTAYGPFARGHVVDGDFLTTVRWDNGETRPVHPGNLEVCR